MSVARDPGVTLFGEILQVGEGATPTTEQVSAMAALKPPCEEKLKTSLTLLPAFTVRLAAAGVKVKSGGGLKVAVTVWSAVKVMLQTLGSLPVQAPLQLPKMEFPDGTALIEMVLPGASEGEQSPFVLVQINMAASWSSTSPAPLPASVTERMSPLTKLAVTL